MKKNRAAAALLTAVLTIVVPSFMRAQVADPKQVASQDASNHANNDVNSSINNGLNKTENAFKGFFKKKNKAKVDSTQSASATAGSAGTAGTAGNAGTAATAGTAGAGGSPGTAGIAGAGGTAATAGTAAATTGPATLNTYANYDFVPGEQIVFEDHFTDDQDAEFPAHWRLDRGQGIVNKVGQDPAFFLYRRELCPGGATHENGKGLSDG